jgi:hypothetical protein
MYLIFSLSSSPPSKYSILIHVNLREQYLMVIWDREWQSGSVTALKKRKEGGTGVLSEGSEH